MKKVKIKYVGKHQPKEELEVDEQKAIDLLGLPDYTADLDTTTDLLDILEDTTKPDISWTEKQIKQWLIDNNIPIEYDIKKETKKDKLKEIEEYFHGKF